MLRFTNAFFSTLLFGLSSWSSSVKAVLYGDEQFLDVEDGRFWAFYSEGIAVINPDTCEIEHTLTEDHEGKPLPLSWNDGVYMQSNTDGAGYIMIGSRVDRTNDLGDTVSDVYAISTTDLEVVDTIEVG